MSFGPKRGHIVTIFEHIISDSFLLIAALVYGFVTRNPWFLLDNLPVLLVVLIAPVIRLIGYLCTTLQITDDKIIYRTGWLNKSVSEIPVKSVTTVDLTQNIINQFTGTCSLAIDNAGNMAEDSTQVRMTFGRQEAEEIRSMIKPGSAVADISDGEAVSQFHGVSDINTKPQYRCPAHRLFIMGAIKGKAEFIASFWALFIAGIGVLLNFINVDENSAHMTETWIEKVTEMIMGPGTYLTGYTVLIVEVLMALIVISVVGGGIYAVIKYMDFSLWKQEDALRIRYGFFTKKSYTIPKDRITGFEYKQSLIMRIARVGMLQCIAIGYGSGGNEDTSEESLLFPWISDNEVEDAIEMVLGEDTYPAEKDGLKLIGKEEELETRDPQSKQGSSVDHRPFRPKTSSAYYFLYSMSMVAGIAGLAAAILLYEIKGIDIRWLGILVLLLGIGSCFLQFRNSELAASGGMIQVKSGGFNTVRAYIRETSLESVSELASVFKRRKGITSVTCYYMAPRGTGNVTARNIPIEAYGETKDRLIY